MNDIAKMIDLAFGGEFLSALHAALQQRTLDELRAVESFADSVSHGAMRNAHSIARSIACGQLDEVSSRLPTLASHAIVDLLELSISARDVTQAAAFERHRIVREGGS